SVGDARTMHQAVESLAEPVEDGGAVELRCLLGSLVLLGLEEEHAACHAPDDSDRDDDRRQACEQRAPRRGQEPCVDEQAEDQQSNSAGHGDRVRETMILHEKHLRRCSWDEGVVNSMSSRPRRAPRRYIQVTLNGAGSRRTSHAARHRATTASSFWAPGAFVRIVPASVTLYS